MAVTTARERLADVRTWRRATVQGPGVAQRLDAVYTVVFVGGVFGSILYDAAHTALAEVLTVRGTATWGAAVLLVALVVVARWGAYQGPVIYAVADVGHLLGAPLSRRGLAVRRLVRGFVLGAVAGALLGGLAVVGFDGRGISGGREAALVGSLALVGVLGVAAASAVQSSARVERLLGPVTLVAIAAAAGAGTWGDSRAGVRSIERWSGPWGWATASTGSSSWPLALALLVAAAVVAVWSAIRGCGRCPTERHVRRAEAREGAVASLAGFDARSMRRALQDVGDRGRPRAGGASLPRPRRPELLLAWRGAVALSRTPGRALEALVLGCAGAALALVAADRITAILLGGLALYLAATRLLEPLRQEVDAPGRTTVLLREAWGEVLFQHTFLPLGGLMFAIVGTAVVSGATGTIQSDGGALAAVTLMGAPTCVMAAALSARRGGRLPMSVLQFGSAMDGGGFLVVGWLVLWPLVGTVGAAGPVALVAHGGSANLPWGLALGGGIAFVLSSVLRASERP